MGLTLANAKTIAGKILDNGGNAEIQKLEDSTYQVLGWLPGETFTTTQANAVAAFAAPTAVARSQQFMFTDA